MEAEFQTLIETANKLAFLTESLERRSLAAVAGQEQAGQNLAHTVGSVRGDVERIVQGASQQIATVTRQSVGASMADGTEKLQQAISSTSSQISASTQSLTESLEHARAIMSSQIKMTFGAIVLALVLVVAGGCLAIWMEWQSYNDAKARTVAAQMDAETAEAYAQVGMTSCGGRLCIKLDAKSPRWGEKGEYILVDVSHGAKK
ncbi:hypothetical protein [Rhodanobacter sp. L36]|uniref:hypothetical protein n=1 Tax=Rhodanobacter sp. L36 TaxID=1747221 RepID=UPI00131BDCFC|nr:hypothetical protein [Rhodanobacter sp. L36]